MTTSQLESSLDRINEWIRAVDQKISIGLVFEAGLVTLLAAPTYHHIRNYRLHSPLWLYILTLVTMFFVGLSLALFLIALKPRLRNAKGTSVLYFGTIAAMGHNKFIHKLTKMNQKKYDDELTEQIYINSVIATAKHKRFALGLVTFVIGFICWLVLSGFIYK